MRKMFKLKNKVFYIFIISLIFIIQNEVFAADHTIFINHASTQFPISKDFQKYGHNFQARLKDFHGINFQYHYEWNFPISLVTSSTYSSSKELVNFEIYAKNKNFYKSFLLGPAYRINNCLSFYVLAGVAHTKQDFKMKDLRLFNTNYIKDAEVHTIHKKRSIAYGLGFIIKPIKTFSINFGYERTNIHSDHMNFGKAHGIVLGIGYKF